MLSVGVPRLVWSPQIPADGIRQEQIACQHLLPGRVGNIMSSLYKHRCCVRNKIETIKIQLWNLKIPCFYRIFFPTEWIKQWFNVLGEIAYPYLISTA